MRKAVAFLLLLLPAVCLSQIAVQWSPADFTLYAPVAQQITITPLWSYTAFGSNIVDHEDRSFSTGTIITSTGKTLPGIPGSLIVSNIIPGGYEVEFFKFNNPTPVASFTNVFTNGTPAFVNAKDYFGVSTNSTLENQFAYTMAEVDAMFASFSGGGPQPTVTGTSGITVTTSTRPDGGTNFALTVTASGAGSFNGPGSAVAHNFLSFADTTGAAGEDSGKSAASFDTAGAAFNATNHYPWGALYDSAGSATASTNGYPWGPLYDATGSAAASTNGLGITSGLAAFRGTNTLASTNVATASKVGLVKVDNSSITVSSDGTISATTGGSGTVTSVALTAPGEFTVSGSPVTGSGTLAITRTANADFLGTSATNMGALKVTNTVSIGGQVTMSALVLTNGFTNQAATASTAAAFDAHKQLVSVPGSVGVETNDGAGNLGFTTTPAVSMGSMFGTQPIGTLLSFSLTNNWAGTFNVVGGLTIGGIPVPTTNQLLNASGLGSGQYVATDANTNLVPTQNGNNWTNTITWINPGYTNVPLAFNGTIQTLSLTNAPKDVFFTFSGANGSIACLCPTNTTIHLPYPVKWYLGASNSVVTNGTIEFDSYGGTNYGQLWSGIGEGM